MFLTATSDRTTKLGDQGGDTDEKRLDISADRVSMNNLVPPRIAKTRRSSVLEEIDVPEV